MEKVKKILKIYFPEFLLKIIMEWKQNFWSYHVSVGKGIWFIKTFRCIKIYRTNIMYEMSRQSRFDARYWMLGAGALGRPRGMVWVGRREEGSGWGTHVYLWRIHFDIWQNQYNIVKLKNKIKLKKKYLRDAIFQNVSLVDSKLQKGLANVLICQCALLPRIK